MACLRRWIVGLIAIVLVGIAHAAPNAAFRIDGFDVEQVQHLVPGAQLNFAVFATPFASASVQIDGSRRVVELREVEPGVYEGSYTIDAADRIRSEGPVVATLWRDGAVARSVLEEPLLLDGPAPAGATKPAVVAAAPGPALLPRAQGMPVPSMIGMRVPPPADAPAMVPVPLAGTWPVALPPPRRVEARCVDCARVESIRAVEAKGGAPAQIGAIAGGLAGALFGEQIGRAHQRHVTAVLGAIGGALIGHEVQRQAEGRPRYEATLRLADGTQRVQRYDGPPPFRVGETIRFDAAASGS